MSNKKPIKKIFESASIESADVHNDLPESVPADAQPEAESPEPNPQEEVSERSYEQSTETEEGSTENLSATAEGDAEIPESGSTGAENEEISSDNSAPTSDDAEETSNDDLLDDVRRSLIEQETEKNQKAPKWWQRIGRKPKKIEPEEAPFRAEIDLSSVPVSAEPVKEEPPTSESENEIDQIDDLIDLLKAEAEDSPVEAVVPPEVETPPEPEPEIDFDELKKQAFALRPEGEEPEQLTDVRSIALEGGEEVLVEVEATPPDTFAERVSAFENALKPYRQFINIALAVLGVGMAVVASLIIYNVYQRSRPIPVKEPSNVPYPTAVSLPGGWSFNLGRGSLQNGAWNPKGAEWLEGTEVCRWVSLPWSRQLEAVIRTLNPKDPIELVMSNNDKFTYEVYSVRQLSPQELQKVDSNKPCLLLILTQPDADKRWVLTALP